MMQPRNLWVSRPGETRRSLGPFRIGIAVLHNHGSETLLSIGKVPKEISLISLLLAL
jgi:hypothetical protein